MRAYTEQIIFLMLIESLNTVNRFSTYIGTAREEERDRKQMDHDCGYYEMNALHTHTHTQTPSFSVPHTQCGVYSSALTELVSLGVSMLLAITSCLFSIERSV